MTVIDRTVIADLEAPSVVYGVHGTDGESQWKCFARRNDLFGSWEAIEWASLPPGGVSGAHLHSRTEELYFIVSGTGLILIDDREYPVEGGDLILTGLGARHGLRNVGADRLNWLVIEVLGPPMAAVLAGQQRSRVSSESTEHGGRS